MPHSRRTFLAAIGAVGAATLAVEGPPQPRGIVHLPTGLLVSIEDEAEREAARRALVGVFGELRVLEMEAVRFPAPQHNEVLWVSCDATACDLEDVRDRLEDLLPLPCGSMLVSNFQGEVTSLSHAELAELKQVIEALLGTPRVG